MENILQEHDCITSAASLFVIEWKISKNVIDKLFDEKPGKLKSAPYNCGFYDSAWYIELRRTDKAAVTLGCFLNMEKCSSTTANIFASGSISLKSKNKDFPNFEMKFNGRNMYIGLGWDIWIHKDKIYEKQFWHDGYLKIESKIQVEVKETARVSNIRLEVKYPKLLETGAFSDVTFCVGGKKFRAHRNILSVSCEYFETMFNSNFKEATEKEITITDLEPYVFEIILKYIYSNQLPTDLGSNTTAFLVA